MQGRMRAGVVSRHIMEPMRYRMYHACVLAAALLNDRAMHTHLGLRW
jgi:hypothetical protein